MIYAIHLHRNGSYVQISYSNNTVSIHYSLKDDLMIDVDGSPLGFIAWYNHKTQNSMIRMVQPIARDLEFGVQRVEMIAVYYGLRDNLESILRVRALRRKICLDVRSDSKSTVEQLQGITRIRDRKLLKITKSILRLLSRLRLQIVFNYVKRNNNMAGYILDLQRRKRYTPSRVDLTSKLSL